MKVAGGAGGAAAFFIKSRRMFQYSLRDQDWKSIHPSQGPEIMKIAKLVELQFVEAGQAL